MSRPIASRKFLVLAAALFAALLTLSNVASAAEPQDVAAAVRAKLDKSQYKDVQVSVDANGIATLSGTVGLYEYKADADKTVHKVKGVTAVRNDIAVGGPSVPDSQLQQSLAEKLTYDRVGYGNVFDAITVQVQNGVVTLGGHAHNYPNRDSALGLVATTPGVKDVLDEIGVDPVSPMDDSIRVEVARAVYSFPSLNRQCGALRPGGLGGRQGCSLHSRQRRSRRLQREELPAGRQSAWRKAEIRLHCRRNPLLSPAAPEMALSPRPFCAPRNRIDTPESIRPRLRRMPM